MKQLYFKLIFFINTLRFIPLIVLFILYSEKKKLKTERDAWYETIFPDQKKSIMLFLKLLSLPEYRSIIYYRLGGISLLFRWIAPGQYALHINTKVIGDNLIIQHGHSTQISAHKIGNNCQIWHNVTIGTNHSHCNNLPEIGNNVKICAGAIVVGKINVGDGALIGAGAVIVKSIPSNCVVVGNPGKIIKIKNENLKIS